MDRFLTCLCDEDYSALIIDGEPTEEEVYQAWIMLLNEYHEIKGDTVTGDEQWQLSRDIARLQNHLFLLQLAVDQLKVNYSESLADSVRKLGYSFRPLVPEPDAYYDLLHRVVNKSRTKYVLLQQLVKELDKKLKDLPVSKPSRQTFEGMLIAFEEMQHTAYNMEEITVYKFLTLEKSYWIKVEALQNKKQAHV
jgi:hypothetical protein